MEPYHINSTTASRAEAERWIAIAEKLLAGRDLIGSKTFAIRARESEPRLEAADQILTVADTLIAGDKRINNQPDWYSILQLPRLTQDVELIAAHYRRLAIFLNPIRSRVAYADQAFQLVSEAWSVLCDSSRKSLYDNELNFFPMGMGLGPDQHQAHEQQQQPLPDYNQPQQPPQQPPPVQQTPPRENPRNNPSSKEREMHNNLSFWTACPYCFNMYEYPIAYEECSLRCQNCRRAFQGVKVAAPPVNEGSDTYFSWGFYPLGVSMSYMEKNKGGVANWTPFSPMFSCPQIGGGGAKRKRGRPRGPTVYIDDDEDAFNISESNGESDGEWGSTKRKKKSKRGRPRKKPQGENMKNTRTVNDGSQVGFVMQEAAAGVVQSAPSAETSRKAAVSSGKKQAGKVPKELGKLDLNVEFSNEVEEPVREGTRPAHGEGTRPAHGEEDGIEGIGFFEGLDEFLSSLPILNVVGDDKVKAA